MSDLTRFSVREAFAGKTLIVTGITGFLGKVWLAYLLDKVPNVGKIRVVIRPKKGEAAQARFDEIISRSPVFRPLREQFGEKLWELIDSKISVHEAKIAEKGCGLSVRDRNELIKDADAVVHFAGLVDFEPEPELAIAANIRGASNVADLAAALDVPRYIHISTAYVAGYADGDVSESLDPCVTPNGETFDPSQEMLHLTALIEGCESKRERIDAVQERANELGWPNIYTFTKSLSERLIALRDDVNAVTVRPAIVECSRHYPFPGWNEGINTSGPLTWLLSTPFQRLPSRNSNHFDVVPVDTVVRATMLAAAASLRDEANEVYHCGSSSTNPLYLERAIELTCLALRKSQAESDDALEKHVARRMDAFAIDPDEEQIFGYQRVREMAKAARALLRKNKAKDWLPPKFYNGTWARFDDAIREFSMQCRTADRKFGQIEEMLRQYRPFIHDYDYRFATGHLEEISARLDEDEAELFAFDIADLCWRHYWTKVQVPGLEKWSIPVLKGDKVPCDDPMPRPAPAAAKYERAIAES